MIFMVAPIGNTKTCEYVSLPLLNKDAASAYGRTEYSLVGNPSRDTRTKKVESERYHQPPEE